MEPPTRPATIYDVAKHAGVSHQTVSRYLRSYQGIRPATKQKVAAALEALNYRPNTAARLLTTGKSLRIAVLTHELKQYGPSQVLQGATKAARQASYWPDVVTLDASDPEDIARAIDTVRLSDLAGVLALSSTDEMTQAFEAVEFGVPAVINAKEEFTASAEPATATLLEPMLEYLASLGHRDYLHIAGPKSWSAARDRQSDFLSAAANHGARETHTVEGDWSAKSAYHATTEFLAGLDKRHGANVTAIVAASDQMALGAMRALGEAGIQIPDEMSVTGMDDIPDAAYFYPPLTTLRLDFEAQGRLACLRLLDKITTEPAAEPAATSPQLIVRASTGPARANAA